MYINNPSVGPNFAITNHTINLPTVRILDVVRDYYYHHR